MSKKGSGDSDQLQLPFDVSPRTPSARIISFADHWQRPDAESKPSPTLTKEAEKKILDRVLERADQLSWYK